MCWMTSLAAAAEWSKNKHMVPSFLTMEWSKLLTCAFTLGVNPSMRLGFRASDNGLKPNDYNSSLSKFNAMADEKDYETMVILWLVLNQQSMNYKLVVAGNQSNGNAGTKACDDAGSKPSSDDEKKVDEDPRKDSESIDQEKDDNVNSTNNVNAASTNEVNVVGGKTSIELPDDPNMPALEDIVLFQGMIK
ncbi:hypothetical protein Tco_0404935 [Tanacetum coccineum]